MAWMLGAVFGVMSLFSWRVLPLDVASASKLVVLSVAATVLSCWYLHGIQKHSKGGERVKPLSFVILLLFGGVAGLSYSQWRAGMVFADLIAEDRDGLIASVNATVYRSDCRSSTNTISQAQFKKRSCKLDLKLHRANELLTGNAVFKRPAMVRVSYYGKRELPAGATIKADIKLRTPRSFGNPGGFDVRRYYLASGLSARGYIKSLHYVEAAPNNFLATLVQMRYYFVAALYEQTRSLKSGAVLMALMVGEKQYLVQDDRQLFMRSGVSHLLAISGLHIGIAAGMGMLLANLIIQVFPQLLLRFPLPVWQALFAIPLASIYAYLAGFALPTQRALIMLSLLMLCRCLNHSTHALNILLFTLFSVLLFNPLSVLDGGFWFSFGAVAILILCWGRGIKSMDNDFALYAPPAFTARIVQTSLRYLKSLARVQFALMIAMPIFLLPFGLLMPAISPLANALAVPLVSLLVVPLLFLGLTLLPLRSDFSLFVFSLADGVLGVLKSVLRYIDTLGGIAFGEQSINSLSTVIWLIFAYLCYLLIRAHSWRLFALAAFLWMLQMLPYPASWLRATNDHELTVTQLDVGQGTAILLSINDRHWLYDTGAKYSEQFDMGDAVIVPYLLARDIQALDTVVLSHGDNDHVGGFNSVHKRLPINAVVLTGENEHWSSLYSTAVKLDSIKSSDTAVIPCIAGQQWGLGPFEVKSLWPPRDADGLSDNDTSCVLQLSHTRDKPGRDRSLLLLPGDISKRSERILVEQFGAALSTDLLVLAHHGSHSSTSRRWLEAIQPNLALVSAGFNNRYGHPGIHVRERLARSEIPLLSTSNLGAIQFHYDDGRWSGPYCGRYLGRYFWQGWDNRDVCIGPLN